MEENYSEKEFYGKIDRRHKEIELIKSLLIDIDKKIESNNSLFNKKAIIKFIGYLIPLGIAFIAIFISINPSVFQEPKSFFLYIDKKNSSLKNPCDNPQKIEPVQKNNNSSNSSIEQYVFWLDVSKSVNGKVFEQLKEILIKLIKPILESHVKSKIAVYTIGNEYEKIIPLKLSYNTDLKKTYKKTINELRQDEPSEHTEMLESYDEIVLDDNIFKNTKKNIKRNFLVILSDMKDDSSPELLEFLNIQNIAERRRTFIRHINQLTKLNFSVYGIAVNLTDKKQDDKNDELSLIPLFFDNMEPHSIRMVEAKALNKDDSKQYENFLYKLIPCEPIRINYWGYKKDTYGAVLTFDKFLSKEFDEYKLQLCYKNIHFITLKKNNGWTLLEQYEHLKFAYETDKGNDLCKNINIDGELITIKYPVEIGKMIEGTTIYKIHLKPKRLTTDMTTNEYKLLLTNDNKRNTYIIPIHFKKVLIPYMEKNYKRIYILVCILVGILCILLGCYYFKNKKLKKS
jgi:hypothetical protein